MSLKQENTPSTPPEEVPLEERWSPERFKTAHMEIARLSVAGYDPEEIAVRVGLSPTTVVAVINSAGAQERIRAMVAPLEEAATELHMQVQAGATIAFSTQLGLMTSPKTPAGTRAGIAKDIMDRGGPMRREGNVSAIISENRLEELRGMIGDRSREGL